MSRRLFVPRMLYLVDAVAFGHPFGFLLIAPQPGTKALAPDKPLGPDLSYPLRSFLSRIVFRFALVYLLLYCYFGLGIIPFVGDWLVTPINLVWQVICPWVAVHIFHLSGPVTQYHPTCSGDTTLDYIQLLCYAVLAMLVAVTWSILDRSDGRAQILYPWVRLIVRFILAGTLLFYGAGKVYPLQFPAPDFTRLSETFGEASPMGLMWAFMGASPAYERFSGWAEVLPGLLLLFRRTSTAGHSSPSRSWATWLCSTFAMTCQLSCSLHTFCSWHCSCSSQM